MWTTLRAVADCDACTVQEGGLPMDGVDWVVCNSGADIWHNFRDGTSEKAGWHADEAWEDHINFRCRPGFCAAHAASVSFLHQMRCRMSCAEQVAMVQVREGQAGRHAAVQAGNR